MRRFLAHALVLFALAPAALAQTISYYHEASCPSVDRRTMTRLKRDAAVALGMLPAPDCHPDARVRYLGISGGGWTAAIPRVHVNGYDRADGTHVPDYDRRPPSDDAARTQNVNGYDRADGTHVDDYVRRPAKRD